MDSQELSHKALQALIDLDVMAIKTILGPALQVRGSEQAFQAIDTILVPALERMGTLWEKGDVALSQLYLCGKFCEELFAEWPDSAEQRLTRQGPRMGIAVLEDYHLLGKRMVHSALLAAGYQLLDYGRSTVDQLIESVRRDGTEILFISTLMLPSALRVERVSSGLAKAGIITRVIVGGAPFRYDRGLWQEVGASGMGVSATDAIGFVQSFQEEVPHEFS